MIVITGNSHVGAIRRSEMQRNKLSDARLFVLGTGNIELTSFSRVSDGHVHFLAPDVSARLRFATASDTIGGEHVWGFVLGTHNSPLYGHRYWRKAEPQAIARSNVRPVSSGLMNEVVKEYLKPQLDFFRQLQSIGTDFFVISGPPPKLDSPFFKRGIRPETIVYIDNLLRNSLSDWLEKNNIAYIAPPQKAVANDGFLKPHYSQKINDAGTIDPHHANSDYGELMADKIYDHLKLNNYSMALGETA